MSSTAVSLTDTTERVAAGVDRDDETHWVRPESRLGADEESASSCRILVRKLDKSELKEAFFVKKGMNGIGLIYHYRNDPSRAWLRSGTVTNNLFPGPGSGPGPPGRLGSVLLVALGHGLAALDEQRRRVLHAGRIAGEFAGADSRLWIRMSILWL